MSEHCKVSWSTPAHRPIFGSEVSWTTHQFQHILPNLFYLYDAADLFFQLLSLIYCWQSCLVCRSASAQGLFTKILMQQRPFRMKRYDQNEKDVFFRLWCLQLPCIQSRCVKVAHKYCPQFDKHSKRTGCTAVASISKDKRNVRNK